MHCIGEGGGGLIWNQIQNQCDLHVGFRMFDDNFFININVFQRNEDRTCISLVLSGR